MREALDRCLHRIQGGESLAGCLAEHPAEAEALEPLLRLAVRMQRDAAADGGPPPPGGLHAGRERMLAAAAAIRQAHALEPHPGEAEAAEALDRALMRGAGEMRAKLPAAEAARVAMAERLRAEVRPVPDALDGLAAGRARFLAVAAAAARAAAEGAETLTPAAEALDRCLTREPRRVQGGAMDDAAPDGETRALAGMATRLRQQTILPPAPPAGLAPGRQRMLDVAARAAAQHGALAAARDRTSTPPSWRERLSGLLQLGGSEAGRLALASLGAVLIFLGATSALETQAREALPGDPLYGIKRINESIDLVLAAVSTDSVQDLRAEQARLRALEVEQLLALGREAEGSIEGALLRFARAGISGDEPYGSLTVRVPPRGEDADEHTYGWDGSTSFDPGAWGSMSSVPKGSRIKLRVVSARTPQGHALALAVRVLDQPDQPLTATATITATATVTGSPTATVPAASATPIVRATQPLTATLEPTASPTLTPTLRATATLSPTLTPAPSPTAEAPETAVWDLNRFRGLVLAKQHPDLWTLREIASRQEVDFDLSLVSGEVKAGIDIGDLVELAYRKGTTPRQVERMVLRAVDAACAEGTELGTVARVSSGQLELTSGSVYAIPDRLRPMDGLAAGVVVEIRYRDCLGQRELLSLEIVEPADEAVVVEGQIQALRWVDARSGSFQLDGGERVTFDAETRIVGMATTLAEGQYVEVSGRAAGEATIRAETIQVLELPTPDAPAPEPTRGAGSRARPPLPSPEPPGSTVEPPRR